MGKEAGPVLAGNQRHFISTAFGHWLTDESLLMAHVFLFLVAFKWLKTVLIQCLVLFVNLLNRVLLL